MTATLSRFLVAHIVRRTTNIAPTILATEQVRSEQIKRSILTFGTLASLHRRLTRTLARLRIASIQRTDRTINEALTILTTVRIGSGEIPVQWATFVTDSAMHTFLTLTQLPCRYRTTSSKSCYHTGRITVAFLTGWEVVEPFLALLARLSIEVILTLALSIVGTGFC